MRKTPKGRKEPLAARARIRSGMAPFCHRVVVVAERGHRRGRGGVTITIPEQRGSTEVAPRSRASWLARVAHKVDELGFSMSTKKSSRQPAPMESRRHSWGYECRTSLKNPTDVTLARRTTQAGNELPFSTKKNKAGLLLACEATQVNES